MRDHSLLSLHLSILSERLFSSPLRQATFESVLTGLIGQVVLMISGILVARILGMEGRGYLAMLVLFPVLISQLGTLGLPQATTYYVAVNRNLAPMICHSLRVPFLFQITVLPIIHYYILRFYLSEQPNQIVMAGYFTLAVIPGMLAQRYGLALLQGLKMFRTFNVMRLLPAATYSGAIILVFAARTGKLPVIIFSWMFLNVIVGIITLCFAYKRVSTIQPINQDDKDPSFMKMLHFGVKGFVGELSPLESFRLDQLMAGLLLSPAALGLYVIAQAFTNLPRFVAQSIGMIAYPAICAHQNTGTAKRTLWHFIWITSVFNCAVVLSLIIFMPVLIPSLFGNEFSASIPLARLLLLGAFFVSCRRIIVEGIRGMGKPEVSTWAEVSMYPFLLIFGPLLITYYHLMGLVVTVVLCYFLSLLVAISLFINFEKSKLMTLEKRKFAKKPLNKALCIKYLF